MAASTTNRLFQSTVKLLATSTTRVRYLSMTPRCCNAAEVLLSRNDPQEFGLVFDIDGVITRGRTLLPHSKSAFKRLTDPSTGKFTIPSIFVTNAGNSLRELKAKQLSDYLGVQIYEDQIVMSHSPLKMFRQYLDKHVLVTGQGPAEEIARHLGFTKITTMDTFRQCFPLLDACDHKRRKAAPCAFEKFFPKIEAVIMFGEPVRWETSLQLLVDILVSDGRPFESPAKISYPHLPVLACNMDLMWMSEAPMPRFGHGCFMHCLESLYKKITGNDLKYTALVGKPSEITYHYAEHMLQLEAHKLGLPRLHRMYCIGDNPDTDIYGANLFNRSIQNKREKLILKRAKAKMAGAQTSYNDSAEYHLDIHRELSIDVINADSVFVGVQQCESVLVCTGIFDGNQSNVSKERATTHNHRDFVMDNTLCVPSLATVHNVLEAVDTVLHKELALQKQT